MEEEEEGKRKGVVVVVGEREKRTRAPDEVEGWSRPRSRFTIYCYLILHSIITQC